MRAAGLVAGLIALSLAACAGPSPSVSPSATAGPTPTPSTTTPEQAPVIDVEVGPTGAVVVPATLEPGAYVFRVTSAQDAMVAVIEPLDGYTLEELAADFGPGSSEEAYVAASTRFDTQGRSLGGTWSEPGSQWGFALALEAGTYWVVDLYREPGPAGDDDVLDPANVATVTVTGSPVQRALPDADGMATASSDRSWDLPETLPAQGTLLVRNVTPEGHQLVFDPVPADVTAQQWLDLTRGGRGMDCACRSPAKASAGTEFLWAYDLPPGEYLVMDFSPGEHAYPQYNGAGASIVRLT